MTKKKNANKELVFNLVSFFKPYKMQCTGLISLVIISLIISAVQPIIWSQLLSSLYDLEFDRLKKILILISIAYILQIGVNFFQSITVNFLKNELVKDIQNDLLKTLLNKRMKYFDKTASGSILSIIITDVDQAVEIMMSKIFPAITSLLQIIIFLSLMFRLDKLLSIFSLLYLPIMLVFYHSKIKQIKPKQLEVKQINDNVVSFIQQTIQGIKNIKIFGIKTVQKSDFNQLTENKRNKSFSLQTYVLKFQTMLAFLGMIGELINYVVGGIFVFRGIISVESFIQFVSYKQKLDSSSLSIVNIVNDFQQLIILLQRLATIQTNLSESEVFGNTTLNITNSFSLELKNVSCGYENNLILKDVSARFVGNGLYAIIGESGSGKTTLINHILHLYPVTSGEILINNTDIKHIEEVSLRESIAVVNQNVFVFNKSIIANFTNVNPNINLDEISNYCKECKIHQAISTLPNQYDTIIEEGGTNFSIGQLQRLSIAITCAKNSPIIILDEPTSSLDVSNSKNIKDIVNRLSKFKLVILITHDYSLLNEAQFVYKIQNRTLSEECGMLNY